MPRSTLKNYASKLCNVADLYNHSSTLLTLYLDLGVNKVILCCGTNDITNLPFTSHSVQEIAQHVSDVVSKFNTLCNSKHVTLLYVTPTPNSYVSHTGFKEFSKTLNSLLTTKKIHYIQPFEILKTSPNMSYEDVIRHCISDQLHWTFEASRRILKASSSHFSSLPSHVMTRDIVSEAATRRYR